MGRRKITPSYDECFVNVTMKKFGRNKGWFPKENATYFEENINHNNDIKAIKQFRVFRLLFALFFISGIKFPIPEEKSYVRYIASRLWVVSFTIFIVVVYFLSMLTAHNFLTDMPMRVTFYALNTFSLITRILIHFRIKRVHKIIFTICRLAGEFSRPHKGTSIKVVIVELLLLAPFSLCITGTMLGYFFGHTDVTALNMDMSIFGYRITDIKIREQLTWWLTIAMTISYTMSVIISGLGLFLCCNTYVILRSVILNYGQHLKTSLGRETISVGTLAEASFAFRRTVNAVIKADETLSEMALFIYGAALSGFLNTISIVLSENTAYRDVIPTVFVINTSSMSTIAFLLLTCSASGVQKASDKLKAIISGCSEHVISRVRNSTESLVAFGLLLTNILGSNIYLTGGDMFIINKGFILTTIGALVTYGVILMQRS